MLSVLIIMSIAQHAAACVGKTLYVGISGSSQDVLSAEIISQFVAGHTGTTQKPCRIARDFFKSKELI